MRIKEHTHQTASRKTEFPQEEVLKIGAHVEAALFEESPSLQNIRILEYLEEYIRFRKNTAERNNDFSLIRLKELEERMDLQKKEVYVLNLWARGSRESIDQTLSEIELDFLYERIKNKLNENPS